MKYLYALLVLLSVIGCSKDDDVDNKERTLELQIASYETLNITKYHWVVELLFNRNVTMEGSIKVAFDVYNKGTFYEHFSEKIDFSIANTNSYLYHTDISSYLSEPEIRNFVVDSLVQTVGDYSITIE